MTDGGFASPESVAFAPHTSPTGSLLVIFAAANAAAGKFTFFKNTEAAGCDRLFIRDPHLNAWYQKGFVGEQGFDASLGALRRFTAGYDFVAMAGSSMGAYASILFGSLLGASRMLAIGPQTELNPAYSRSPKRGTPLIYPCVDQMIADAGPEKLDIAVGLFDAVDYFNIARLPMPLTVGMHCFPTEDHFLPKTLSRSGHLSAALAAVAQDKPISFAGADVVSYGFDDHRADVIRRVVPLIFEAKSYKRARSEVREALLVDPDWLLGRYLWAAAAFKLGLPDLACRRLSRYALEFPAAVDFNSLAAEAALASGRNHLAVAHARNLLKVRASLKRPREILEGTAQPMTAADVDIDQAPDEPPA